MPRRGPTGPVVRWIGRATLIGILLGMVGGSLAAPARGSMAPDFSLALLDGRRVSLQDFRGKPVLLNFWHSG